MTRFTLFLIFYSLEALSLNLASCLCLSHTLAHISTFQLLVILVLWVLSPSVWQDFLFNPAWMSWSNTSSDLMAISIQSHVSPTYRPTNPRFLFYVSSSLRAIGKKYHTTVGTGANRAGPRTQLNKPGLLNPVISSTPANVLCFSKTLYIIFISY